VEISLYPNLFSICPNTNHLVTKHSRRRGYMEN